MESPMGHLEIETVKFTPLCHLSMPLCAFYMDSSEAENSCDNKHIWHNLVI